MANGITVRERLLPDLFLGEWIDPMMHLIAHHHIVIGKVFGNDLSKISHSFLALRGVRSPWCPGLLWLFVPVDYALFHHEENVLRLPDILEWVARHCHDVGQLTCFECSDLGGKAQQIRVA